jgi:serine/threonine protein kinase
MGEIYKGHEIQSGDSVAIKVLRNDLANNETALALFRKEAKALRSLHHEAIVRYYVFSDDPGIGRHYLAMEFVRGERLSDIIQRRQLSFDQVRQLQQRLSAALHEAHRNDIVHRDVSPDNVLVPEGDVGRAKIIDFGIARSTRSDDTTIIGVGFAGKYNYVSPEQLGLFGGDITAKSDIYSLGLVLAQCLRGRPINMSGTQFEMLENRRLVPDLGLIDQRFRPLLEQMLQPNPADRPESMAAVAAWRPASEMWPPPRPAAATPGPTEDVLPTAVNTATAKSKLGRPLAIGLGLVLLLAIGSAGFYFSISPPERPPTDPNEFLSAYDGGDCFFITPERLSDDQQTRDVDGLGRAKAPFDILNSEFRRRFGSESTIGWHEVTPEQCPAVNFLFRTRNQSGAAPRLDIDTAGLPQDPPVLSGFIAEFGDRHVELLLITDDGYVQSATEYLKPASNGTTFTVELDKAPIAPGLVFAIASSKPLEALKLPSDWSLAEEVFPKVLTEALQRGLTLNVSAKYFKL